MSAHTNIKKVPLLISLSVLLLLHKNARGLSRTHSLSVSPPLSFSSTHARTHTHIRMRTRTHTHTHTQIRMRTHTHTHSHTHTHYITVVVEAPQLSYALYLKVLKVFLCEPVADGICKVTVCSASPPTILWPKVRGDYTWLYPTR